MALEQFENSLKDYNTVVELDADMKKMLKKEYEIILIKTGNRQHFKLQPVTKIIFIYFLAPKKEWSSWSSKKNCKQIDFIDKPPHLRSKVTLENKRNDCFI
jgi:hypothetical protein